MSDAKEDFPDMSALEPMIFSIDEDQEHYSAIPIRVKRAEIQDLFDENMSLRLSGLGFPIKEVFSGKFPNSKEKDPA